MDDSLKTIKLSRNAHKIPEDGTCLMEAVSLISGEIFSDIPLCVDRNICKLGIFLNDHLNDEDRNELLLPFLYRIPGTKNKEVYDIRDSMLKKYENDFRIGFLINGIQYSDDIIFNKKDQIIIKGTQLLDDMIKLTEIKETSVKLEKTMV